ncbi:Endolytic murein transglycosylase [Hyella patelloides LEGE 07179]|uniref:Endolytic murein transglycosylase n=1 Tax=Hyella patelloides LEGE 07179 TaxID=945734 RepID=A0A563VKV3_9CYAN|nr:endolytic transglycosylase MltG [Hyella patelloides]VEP11963.1 Endolytic murein transglycosylase [Hyella patelloides LEGE 07179]
MTLTKKKSPLPLLLGILALAIGGGIGGSWFWWQKAIAPVAAETELETAPFTVESGMGGQQIGNKLAEEGLIKSATAWKVWTKLQQQQDNGGGFKAGTYLVSLDESLPDIATKIWNGEIMQTNFTIPEGWSMEQMANYFESLDYFTAEEFLAATREIPYEKYSWLPKDIPHLEGFLYPDTYKISSDRTNDPQAVIDAMLKSFENIALPVYKEANTDYSLQEWVTLASIVEKESVIQDERPLIAGVFTARLEQGMRLESDPTVEYGLGIRQTADRPLTYAQVGTPSPYNTYRNFGLPPTAIAAPGIASLKATLNPESTEYLFFVARYDGTHVFSRTLQEHEAATRRIRNERNARQN